MQPIDGEKAPQALDSDMEDVLDIIRRRRREQGIDPEGRGGPVPIAVVLDEIMIRLGFVATGWREAS